ncbi:MAG: lipoyl protein ligase domain-containing protein [Oceanipulchritudo sp.]
MRICQIPHDRDPAAGNMAIDATMLVFGRNTTQAVWRLYGWSEPAITFGYSQRWAFVCSSTEGFGGARIRRMTGGGIVDHRRDLTYAVTIPPEHPCYRFRALEVYRLLHMQIAHILMESGIPARLAPCPGDSGEGCSGSPAAVCFEAPAPHDVVHPVSGAKIAGAAMKRTRDGVLIQGSLNRALLGGIPDRHFEEKFGQALANWLELEPVVMKGTLPVDVLQRELDRFSSGEWNQAR